MLRKWDKLFGFINFLYLFSELIFCLGEYPELLAPCGLHQGHRCVERGVRLLCIQRPPRVCPRQLRFQVSEKKNPQKIFP
jgi:hypothetical protein